MLLAMMQHPDFAKYDLSSLELVLSGGSPVPVYLMEQVKERIGADVVSSMVRPKPVHHYPDTAR